MKKDYFLTVCLNPTMQKTLAFKSFTENEVNRCSEYYLNASGKGINVTRVLVQLDASSVHLTQTGGRNKELFLNLARKDGLSIDTVESHSEIRYCYTLLNREKQTTTEIVEESEETRRDTENRVMKHFLSLLSGCHTLILSGTKAAGFSDKIFPEMVRLAKELNKKVILDVKGNDLKNSLPYRPDIIKPNFTEFCGTFLPEYKLGEHDRDEETENLVKDLMSGIYQDFGVRAVLTRGKLPVLFLNNGEVQSIPVKPITPVNTIGSGDAFTAGFAIYYHQEKSIRECVKYGVEISALNASCLKPGSIF